MLYLVYYEYSREMVGGGVSSTQQVQSRQRCLVLWCYALGDVHIRTGIHSFILLFILSFFIFFASFFYSSSYLISHNLIVFFFLENENKPRKQLINLFIYAVEFYITKLFNFTDGFLFKAYIVKSWFIKTLRNHFKHEVGLPEPPPPSSPFQSSISPSSERVL